jgi:PAS domain S-box-containing protein
MSAYVTTQSLGTSRSNSFPRTAALALVVGFCYWTGTRIGFTLTPPSSPISTLWPPNAILLAAFLLSPKRIWWAFICAVVPAHFLVQLGTGVPFLTSLGWLITNLAEALLGAWSCQYFLQPRNLFNTFRSVGIYILLGVMIAPFLTSFLDSAIVILTDFGNDFWLLFRTRLLSNSLSNLVLVPAIVLIVSDGKRWVTNANRASIMEWTLLMCGILITAVLSFGGLSRSQSSAAALIYAPLPLLLWAAVRFGTGGVSLSMLIVAFFAIWNATHGRGPFALSTPEENVLSLQLFLIMIDVPLLALAAVIQDRRNVEEALRRNEERVRLVEISADLGFWTFDFADKKIWATQHFRKIIGLESDSTLTQDAMLERVDAEDRDRAKEIFDRAVQEANSYEMEYRIRLENGAVRWISDQGRSVCTTDGKLERMVRVLTDVTDRRVKDMEAHLRQRQLTHLNRVATLGELSGSLAHELNQPLTAILSNAQAAQNLLSGKSADLVEIQEILKDIIEEDVRAGEVIHRLRAMLKKEEVEFQEVNLDEIIREVLHLIRSDIVSRNIKVSTSFDLKSVVVYADRVQLQQVLLNLILNASDALALMPFPDRKLELSTSVESVSTIRVSVTDNGPGIASDILDQIFDPFVSTKKQGLGLGLTISHSIIKHHGGWLQAHNNGDCGSTFSFTLPVHRSA